MKTVTLTQRTQEWLDWRKNSVTASDMAAVLGMSKYKSPKDIWLDKTGRGFPEPMNFDMQRGVDLEDNIRHKFQSRLGGIFLPLCAESEECSIIRASFDGVNANEDVFAEYKAPRTRAMLDILASNDIELVKEKYLEAWIQVQTQHYVIGSNKKGYLVAYQNDEMEYMEIHRDEEFINKTLIPGVLEFWKYVENDIEPPSTNSDYIYIDNDNSRVLAQEWKYLDKQSKALESRKNEVKQQLCDLGDDGNCNFSNMIRMTRIASKGRVNTKKLYEAYNIKEEDLDRFRGDEIGFYKITVINE